MLEIESKFRVQDWGPIQMQIIGWGARLLSSHEEEDLYFNAPDRDFRLSDEVLRLRCVGLHGILTYKGKKRSGDVKSRAEIEVPILPGEVNLTNMRNLLISLGYRYTATVRKQRETYTLHRGSFEVHICFDEVQEVGQFIELEVVALESQMAQAQDQVQQLATELNLAIPEPRSYLRMVLEAIGSNA